MKPENDLKQYAYYRMTKTIDYRMNKNGSIARIRKQFTGKNKAEAEKRYQAYLNKKNHYIVNHQDL